MADAAFDALEVLATPERPPLPSRNIEGTLGPRCHDCSGLGRLGSLGRGSGSSHCARCIGTGVEPLTPLEQRELFDRLRGLERKVNCESS